MSLWDVEKPLLIILAVVGGVTGVIALALALVLFVFGPLWDRWYEK